MREKLVRVFSPPTGMMLTPQPIEVSACCDAPAPMQISTTAPSFPVMPASPVSGTSQDTCAVDLSPKESFWKRLVKETWIATTMVIKFMALAWLIGALVKLYVPEAWISRILSDANPWSILTAAALGVPVYTSNLAAMPLIGGLLSLGMHPSAALAFLIAGPMTTLPAMSAVWGLVNRKVFTLYIAFALVGAVVLGYAYRFALLM